MNNFFTGFFTLTAALSSIWLKDYLDNKKIYKSTTKQKATESYILANRVMRSLSSSQLICANLLKDKNYNYLDMLDKFPNTSLEELEKLELLIVENFYDLYYEFINMSKIINKHSKFLSGIILNVPNTEVTDLIFKEKTDQFDSEIIISCNKLQNAIMDKYINIKSHVNIFVFTNSIKVFLQEFIKK